MSFRKTENLPLTFPPVTPIGASRNYWQSKAEARRVRYNPVWDTAKDSASVELLTARRALWNADASLDAKRKEAEGTRQTLNRQWNQLFVAEERLRKMFLKFNKFIKENQEKRDRAAKKIKDETAMQDKWQRDAKHMGERYAYITGVKNSMEAYIKEYGMYEDYLDAVVKASISFKNINEILFRYEALIEARNTLSVKQDADLRALEAVKVAMEKLVQDKRLVIVGQINFFAGLQERYTSAKQRSLLSETAVARVHDVSSAELSKIQQVRSACYDMYRDMCRRRRTESSRYEKHDTCSQLLFIKKTLHTLNKICNRVGKST